LLKRLRTIVLLNAILVLLFVFTTYAIANVFNSHPNTLFRVNWPFAYIEIVHEGAIVDGNYVGIGGTEFWIDYPLWIFFASTVVNMVYIAKLLKEQESKKT